MTRRARGIFADAARFDAKHLAQIAPSVEAVAIFHPTVTDIGAVIHVWDHHVFDARIGLSLGLLHRLAGASDGEYHAGSTCDEPFAADDLHVFDVVFVVGRLFEND